MAKTDGTGRRGENKRDGKDERRRGDRWKEMEKKE